MPHPLRQGWHGDLPVHQRVAECAYPGPPGFAHLVCYSFEEARPYAAQAAEICRLPADMGWWKAHNFVEMALEWLLARQAPSLAGQLQQAFEAAAGPVLHPALARLIPHLATFFGQDGKRLIHSLPAMAPFLAIGQVTPDTLAERYQRQVQLKHGVEAIQVSRAAALIAEIAAAIQPRCWAFLDDVLGQIGGMLEREGWIGG